MDNKEKKRGKVGRFIGRFFAVVGVTILMVLLIAVGFLYCIFRGPSESMCLLVTRSCNETSAMKWVPKLFLDEETWLKIVTVEETAQTSVTNTDLIQIPAKQVTKTADPEAETEESSAATDNGDPVVEESGSGDTPGEPLDPEDPDGDGIIVEEIHGPTYTGYMMIVKDPSRLTLGKPDEYGYEGLTIYEMNEKYHAAAVINAGGFIDINGQGNGGTPEGIVISDGEIVWGSATETYTIVGFDRDHRLIVGTMSGQAALDMNVECCCQFGPSLVINGESQAASGTFFSGVNPRSAIGQRADGAVLLLVIDGRQVYSPGATLNDLVEIMLDYGAVNASNLDGGSSSMLIYNNELLNTCASVIGPRKLPTCFVVLPLESE